MERSKIVAIITGAISLLLAIAYLIIVQFLDFRGEMLPAPVSQQPQGVEVAYSDSHPSEVQIDPSPSPSPRRGGEQESASPFPCKEGG